MKNDLLQRVPFLMHRVVTAMVAAATKGDAPGEFNIHGWRVMLTLLNNPGMSVGDLCSFTRVDQTNMSHLLRRMAKQGVLRKDRSPEDNRVVEVRLTEEGQRLAVEFAERTLRHQTILLNGFSAAEEANLRDYLRRLYANVENASFD